MKIEIYVPEVFSGPLPSSLILPVDRFPVVACMSQSTHNTVPVHVAVFPTFTLMLYV